MSNMDRFTIHSQLQHLQSKYPGTGNADTSRLYVKLRSLAENLPDWGLNIMRDTLASHVGHYSRLAYFAVAENESIRRIRYRCLSVRLSAARAAGAARAAAPAARVAAAAACGGLCVCLSLQQMVNPIEVEGAAAAEASAGSVETGQDTSKETAKEAAKETATKEKVEADEEPLEKEDEGEAPMEEGDDL
ncbi:hypothetical protein Emag_004538 [Eimeria magna]